MVWFLWTYVIIHFPHAGQNCRFMLMSFSLASPLPSDEAWLISKYQHCHLRGRGGSHILLHTQRYWIFSSFLVARQCHSGVNEKCLLLGRDLKLNLLLVTVHWTVPQLLLWWAIEWLSAPNTCSTSILRLHSDPWIFKTGSWAERALLGTHTNKA